MRLKMVFAAAAALVAGWVGTAQQAHADGMPGASSGLTIRTVNDTAVLRVNETTQLNIVRNDIVTPANVAPICRLVVRAVDPIDGAENRQMVRDGQPVTITGDNARVTVNRDGTVSVTGLTPGEDVIAYSVQRECRGSGRNAGYELSSVVGRGTFTVTVNGPVVAALAPVAPPVEPLAQRVDESLLEEPILLEPFEPGRSVAAPVADEGRPMTFFPYAGMTTDTLGQGAFGGSALGAEVRTEGGEFNYNLGAFFDLGGNRTEGLGIYLGLGTSGTDGQSAAANFGSIAPTGGGAPRAYGDFFSNAVPGSRDTNFDLLAVYRDASPTRASVFQGGWFGNPINLQGQNGLPTFETRSPANIFNNDTFGLQLDNTLGASWNLYGDFNNPGGFYWGSQGFLGVRSGDATIGLRDTLGMTYDITGRQPFQDVCRADVRASVAGLNDPRFGTLSTWCNLAVTNPTVFGDVIADDLIVTNLNGADLSINFDQFNLITGGFNGFNLTRDQERGLAQLRADAADGAVVHVGGVVGWRSNNGGVNVNAGVDYTAFGDTQSTAIVGAGSVNLVDTGSTTVAAAGTFRLSEDENVGLSGTQSRTQGTVGLVLNRGTNDDDWRVRAGAGYAFDNVRGDGWVAQAAVERQIGDRAAVGAFVDYSERDEMRAGVRLRIDLSGGRNRDRNDRPGLRF